MQSKTIDRVTLMNITIFMEAFLLLTATFWTQFAAIELANALKPAFAYIVLGVLFGVGLAATSLVLVWLGNFMSSLSGLRELVFTQLAPLFADLNVIDVLTIAVVSGFCEEVLFRGVIQQQLGWIATSVIFGLFHCPSFRHLSYGFWALFAGALLGLSYLVTGSLWVPILAHTVNNCISLLFLRFAVQIEPSEDEEE